MMQELEMMASLEEHTVSNDNQIYISDKHTIKAQCILWDYNQHLPNKYLNTVTNNVCILFWGEFVFP